MRGLVALLIVATALTLAACESKRDICADWIANQITDEKAAKKLNLKKEESPIYFTVKNYCNYIKN